MKAKTTQVNADSLLLRELELEMDRGRSEHEFDVEGDVELAAVLVEIVSGRVDADVTGLGAKELSRYRSVKLYVGCLEDDAKRLKVALSSASKGAVRMTVAFFRQQVNGTRERLSCRACTAVCRFGLRAILAHQGISYLDVEATVDMPGVLDPDVPMPMRRFDQPISVKDLGVDPTTTIPVRVGKPMELGEGCKDFLSDGANGADQLGKLVKRLGPDLMGAMRDALESANWVYDSEDDLYASACRQVGCC